MDILVHISGPSRGADDAKYRKEAKGFLAFVPGERHTIVSLKDSRGGTQVGHSSSHDGDGAQDSDSLRATQRVEAIRRLFHRNFEAITPARANASGRLLQTPALPCIKETPQLLIERTPAIQRPQTAPNAATPPTNTRPFRRTQSDSWQTPPSVVLNSQPTQESTDNRTDSSPTLKRPFQASSPSPNKDSSPSGKRARRKSPPRTTATTADASSDGPSLQALESTSSFSSPPRISLSSPRACLPSQIHPPQPPIGSSKFKSHLTKSLGGLSTMPALQNYHVDRNAVRPIEKLERGHWLVPLRTWEDKTKDKAWKFLHEFVGRGRAGWGVWCIRELLDKRKPDNSDKENQSPGQEEFAKIYCWGEVLGEVYLMIFVAAGKSLRTGGARWIDAGGDVVVDVT